MMKFLVFAILFTCSPTHSLLESLFQSENSCYSGCNTNYGTSVSYADACKKGCDYKLHNEQCADKCQLLSKDEQIHASCLMGCSMNSLVAPTKVEGERPRSIILIRLRQRPLLEVPSFDRMFGGDPVEMFNNMIKQFKEKTDAVEQVKPAELQSIMELVKSIPLMKLSGNFRADSSSESSEESKNKIHRVLGHHHERSQSFNGRFQQLIDNAHTEWKDFVDKKPSMPIWMLVGLFLTLSAILWYMIVSLCRHTPTHHTLSIRANELVFDNADEKHKAHLCDAHYHMTDPSPINAKLSNI